jgi:hypothetical protein
VYGIALAGSGQRNPAPENRIANSVKTGLFGIEFLQKFTIFCLPEAEISDLERPASVQSIRKSWQSMFPIPVIDGGQLRVQRTAVRVRGAERQILGVVFGTFGQP